MPTTFLPYNSIRIHTPQEAAILKWEHLATTVGSTHIEMGVIKGDKIQVLETTRDRHYRVIDTGHTIMDIPSDD